MGDFGQKIIESDSESMNIGFETTKMHRFSSGIQWNTSRTPKIKKKLDFGAAGEPLGAGCTGNMVQLNKACPPAARGSDISHVCVGVGEWLVGWVWLQNICATACLLPPTHPCVCVPQRYTVCVLQTVCV